MTKSVLIMYWHGLGDLICLTPQLRHLHNNGYIVDLMLRHQAIDSGLLKHCPYVRRTIPLPFRGGGPAEGGESGKIKREACLHLFDDKEKRYDHKFVIANLHKRFKIPGGKIFRNNEALFEGEERIPIEAPTDLNLEVFITEEAENKAKTYIQQELKGREFVFKHTQPPFHPAHNWNPGDWMREKGIADYTVFEPNTMSFSKDVNAMFAMAREAKHRVLSSSVFVHACDAMNIPMDVVYYGKPNIHGLPIDRNKIMQYLGNYENGVT